MHFVVFGATGKTGNLVVLEALQRGHTITAFVHQTPPAIQDSRIRIVQGDIHNAFDVAAAIQPGADSVISALGNLNAPVKDILSSAMAGIIPVMQQQRMWRLVSLTGADVKAEGDNTTLLHRISHSFIRRTGPDVLADSERHLTLLAASGLDWTAVRSPVMRGTDPAPPYHLVAVRPKPWQTVPRATVARCLVDMAEHPGGQLRTPFLVPAWDSDGTVSADLRPH